MDSHCHIDFWEAEERVSLLQRAWEAGLRILVTIAVSLPRLDVLRQLCRNWPQRIFHSVGIHPLKLPPSTDSLAKELEGALETARPLALGETGLDFSKLSPRKHASEAERQRTALAAHIAVAKAANLPLVLHCRDRSGETAAWKELNRQLDGQNFPPERALLHCFSYSPEQLHHWQGKGAWVSFAGNVTRSASIADACRASEEGQMLFETDAPFLLPEPLRGEDPNRRNEPAFLALTLERAAQLRSSTAQAMRDLSLANGCRFFGLEVPRG
ncbi:MAG: TatD family hydrolase [Puniceicoccales bacterium]|jgi:TatD DNase family protein|nr:TatD family hydrolase [Puniceicoccales bacterium]